MKKRKVNINRDKFKLLVRYMIQAAQHKRCIPYYELENILCISGEDIGTYAGLLGDYCLIEKLPLLNSLIISSSNCTPSAGFDFYQKKVNKNWGEIIKDCWKKYHVTLTISKLTQNYSKIDKKIDDFFNKEIKQFN